MAWGFLGIVALLLQACIRLGSIAFEAMTMPLNGLQWAGLIGSVVFMGFSEGYRGFQLQFSPRVVARALWLGQNPSLLNVILAPLFCMGFFGATRKRKIVSYVLTAFIICAVIVIRLFSQPWRGIFDAGVVFGLAWGLASMFYFLGLAFAGRSIDIDPELAPDMT